MRFAKRPWGWWLVLYARDHFKIKLLRFRKHGRLSTQYHHDRNELWLFLKGNGTLLNGQKLQQAHTGQSHHIAIGNHHYYKAKEPTWILEIQYGRRCEEIDIVRI